MIKILTLLARLFDVLVFFWIFYLAATQLASENYINGAALIIALAYWQKAWFRMGSKILRYAEDLFEY